MGVPAPAQDPRRGQGGWSSPGLGRNPDLPAHRGESVIKTFFHTFGCRVNQSETELIREKLLVGGHSDAPQWESADLCVINTCTVTKQADRDALRLVKRIRKGNPAARLLVAGCFVTRDPEEIKKAAPEAIVVSNKHRGQIPALLGCRTAPTGYAISDFGGKTRAFVKIQDGCNMSCTYCIIPSVRPDMWSKSARELEAEVRGLVASGYKEVVLCGIRLGRYLDDSEGRLDFVGLLRRLLAIEGAWRLRLSSFEITDVTDRFIALYKDFPDRLCPYLHLPLQSGSDAVLKKMDRWYSVDFFRRRAAALRAAVPEAALFSDIMVAFPGESDDEHQENLRVVEELGFAGLHVFRFSAREGTPAARLKPLPEAVVEARSQEMRALDAKLRAAHAARELGRERRVLVEDGRSGLTEHFLRVQLDRSAAVGAFVPVRILEPGFDGPRAEVL